MKKYLFCMLLVVLFSCPALAVTSEYVEGDVLVVLDAPDASAYSGMGAFSTSAYSQAVSYQAESFAGKYGLEALDTYPEIARISGKNIIHLSSEYKSTNELIKELSSAPGVVSVSPNYIIKLDYPVTTQMSANQYQAYSSGRIPNDPDYSRLWGMENIRMPRVWEHITGSDNVVVAVIDSGINYNHPDLNANMARDSYGNYGRRFDNGRQSGNPMDNDGHGTHVAGIIGAVGNNGIGVVGINWKVKMLAVNALPEGYGWHSDIIAGMNYVLIEKYKGLNIRVVNMSFGSEREPEPDNSPYGTAVKSLNDAGIICVMAAGNENLNLNTSTIRHYPSSYRFTNTISVGAIDSNNQRSIWSSRNGSNYGDRWVDIAAPGSNIYSTYQYGYAALGGTSMAAPHVAGAAAILCAAFSNESASEIKSRILKRAKNFGVAEELWASGTLDVFGAYGMLDIITSDLPDGAIGIAYSQTLSAKGNESIAWSIDNGSLPTGLSLNAATGAITGTPTTAGTFNFTVRATNNTTTTTKAFRIVITATPVVPIIITSYLPDGITGLSYNQALDANGTVPITWSVSSGSLPGGLSLNGTTGVISGMPTTSGTYSFTVRATNAAGNNTRALSIVIVTLPTINTTTLPDGRIGTLYNHTLSASGSTPITWSIVSGYMPDGLSLNANTGVISGTPTNGGRFSFTIIASNARGNDIKDLSLFIDPSFSGSGRGVPGDPYIITTPGQLDEVRKDLGAHYRLGNNIDLSSYLASSGAGYAKWGTKGWQPIGSWTPERPFTGGFDGNGYKITGLWINRSDEDYVGMFGYVHEATIANLGVEIASSGVVGRFIVGGLVGYQYSSSIVNCYATGNVSKSFESGGLVGIQHGGIIENCYATGNVRGVRTGGLVGVQDGEGIIVNSYATGHVSDGVFAGGLVGEQMFGIIESSYATGNVSGCSVGGLIGNQARGIIEKSYAIGNVHGRFDAGGLVGMQENGSIVNSYSKGNVIGEEVGGGLAGRQGGSIVNSYATGNVYGHYVAGGLAGAQGGSSIVNSYATGNVYAYYEVGGLVGIQNGDSIVKNSYATGNVSSGEHAEVGGLVGSQLYNGNRIIDSYRYQLATVNGIVRTENTPNGIYGGIKTSADLKTKATYAGNTWQFNDTTPIGPWYWDSRGFPKLNMGTEHFPFSFTAANPPMITTTSLTGGIVGKNYNQTLKASGATPFYWSIVKERLPVGLSLNATNGAITGVPTAAGMCYFDVGVENSAGIDVKTLIINITEPPTVTTPSLPGGIVGQSYSQTLTAIGTMPITWSISSGRLPTDLSLNVATGVISGTPSAAGTFNFSVRATNSVGNSTKPLSIVITAPPAITSASLNGGIVGRSYNQTLKATGVMPITWSVSDGTLPNGLSLNEATGAITGIPTAAGTFSFTVKATNSAGNTTSNLSIVITAIPIVTTTTMTAGIVGHSYSQTLTATGTTPMTWSISSRVLPAGLSLNETTGVISGTPTTMGTFNFTVKATNSAGNGTSALSIVIAAPPTITTTSLNVGTVGRAYNQTLKASGTTPITWSISDSTLPNGLSLNEATGAITGIPTVAGTFSFTVRAANSAGNTTSNLSIVITAIPTVTTTSLAGGIVGQSYSQILAATGTTPMTWSISSRVLPAGLSLNETTGVISGTPTTMGTFSFTVRATNSAGNGTSALSIVIATPPVITTTLNGGTVGRSYNQTLKATGTTPITWSISSGSLPVGLNLNASTGAITGTPTSMDTFSFTVRAANSAGNTTSNLSIVITAIPTVTTTSLPAGIVGQSYSQTLAATGTMPMTWSISSRVLPAGLSLNETTGVISGTPTTMGTFNFTVKATNSAGNGTSALSIVIAAPPTITTTTLNGGTVGRSYSQTLKATGTTPITWSVAGGSLPTGLNLNSTTGAITGVPTAANTYNFTVRATNSAGNTTSALSIVIN